MNHIKPRSAGTMILPQHDLASGEVASFEPYAADSRIPSRLDFMNAPVVVGHWKRSGACPDGRHLFDLIESVNELEPESRGEDDPQTRFRATLTCVRCGIVETWEGTRRTDTRPRTVDPVPLQAGPLMAQQVSADSLGWDRPDMSTWAVYRDGAKVGVVSWARGTRGRSFFRGFIGKHALDDRSNVVEGPTPAAVLRKLSKLPVPANQAAQVPA